MWSFALIAAAFLFIGILGLIDLARLPTEAPRDWFIIAIQILPVPIALVGFFGGARYAHKLAEQRRTDQNEIEAKIRESDMRLRAQALALNIFPAALVLERYISEVAEYRGDSVGHDFSGLSVPKVLKENVDRLYLLGLDTARSLQQLIAFVRSYEEKRLTSDFSIEAIDDLDEILDMMINLAPIAVAKVRSVQNGEFD